MPLTETHPALVAAARNIAAASDKLRALQAESLRIHELAGKIPDAIAMDYLVDRARAHGLYNTPREIEDIEHIIRSGLAGREALVSSATAAIILPASPARLVMAPSAYHDVVGDVVRTIEPHTEGDPAAILIQLLVAAGNAIGRAPFFQIEGDQHFAKLNVVLVGATSGGRKGTSLSRVLQVMEIADSAWTQYRVQSGLASGEGLIYHVRDPAFRLIDGQMEEVDRGVPDKRLLIDAQEFASVLAVMAKHGNTLSSVIREAWGHKVLQTLSKNSPDKATGSHISIIGHITQQELRKMMTRTEMANGFANRFLFVMSRRSKKLAFGGDLPADELDRLGRRMKEAIERAKGIEKVTMTLEAARSWEKVYEALPEDAVGMVGVVTARDAAHILRLALIYAVLDGSSTIGLAHLDAAVAVWDYCYESARRIFGESTGNPEADKILTALKDAPQGLTRDEIGSHIFSGNKPAREISEALTWLEEQRRVRHARSGTSGRGRPAETWFAV